VFACQPHSASQKVIEMPNAVIKPTEVVSVDFLDDALRVHVRSGSNPIFDEDGHAVILFDRASIGRHLISAGPPDDSDQSWNPWRQGP
jgi:hypothetical protein